MNQQKVYPYKLGSKSAKALANALQCKRIIPNNTSRYTPQSNHIIINWGNSSFPLWDWKPWGKFLNRPDKVQIACNKILTFRRLTDCRIPIPEYKVYKEDALYWIEQGHTVYCRTKLSGHSGKGIVVATTPEELVDAPLYTKEIKATYEYRVHIVNGEIIDFTQKKKRRGAEANPYIRSHAHGWIFAREGVVLPNIVKGTALDAIHALSLDFGAVDVGYVVSEDKAYIYEVNTAPALEGTTLTHYTEAFRRLL